MLWLLQWKLNCKKEWRTKALSGELERICQRILLKRYFWQINEKIFPDKFADKEKLNEEVIYYVNFAEVGLFCKKKGIYVSYNCEIFAGCFKDKLKNDSLLKQLRKDCKVLSRFYQGKEFIFYPFHGPIQMLQSHQIFL